MSFTRHFHYDGLYTTITELPMILMEKIEPILPTPEHEGKKTVALWGDDGVLVTAVEHLLATRPAWKVIRILDTQDELDIPRQFEDGGPDVLIIQDGILTRNKQLLIKFIRDYSELRIITISADDNLMEVYDKQTIRIKEARDLLQIIQMGADPDPPGGAG